MDRNLLPPPIGRRKVVNVALREGGVDRNVLPAARITPATFGSPSARGAWIATLFARWSRALEVRVSPSARGAWIATGTEPPCLPRLRPCVALREGGVDRNTDGVTINPNVRMSPSARGAWIATRTSRRCAA